MILRVLDIYHDSIYESKGISRMYVYSDNKCFGDTPYERLLGFLLWCKNHNVNINDIHCVNGELE